MILLSLLDYARILRPIRIFVSADAMLKSKKLQSARTMFLMIIHSMGTFVTVGLIIVIVMLGFGMVMTDGVAAYVSYAEPCHFDRDRLEECWVERMALYYDSLPTTLLSLWMAVSGGMDWFDLYQPLLQIGRGYAVLSTSYIGFVSICVVNVVTGVFVDGAWQMAQK